MIQNSDKCDKNHKLIPKPIFKKNPYCGRKMYI